MDNPIPTIEPSYAVRCREVHADLGGRATWAEVAEEVRRRWPDLYDRASINAMRSPTVKALTEHDATGLPYASSIPSDGGSTEGEYVQRTLFAVPDYEVTITRYVGQADDLLSVARRLSDECAEKFGVRFAVPYLNGGGEGQVSA